MPKSATGTVTVTKYTCPEGVERSDESFRLSDQCHEKVGPVEFTVRGEGGYSQSAFSDGSIPRAAVFTGVPFGQIEISESIPAGYGQPLAFCSDRIGAMPPVPVDGNTVTWNLRSAGGNALRCLFFNFQEKADGPGTQRGWAQEGLDMAEATGTPETGVVVPAPTETVPRLVDPTVIVIEPGIEPTAAEDPDPTEVPALTTIADDVIPIVIPGGDEPTEPDTAPTTSRVTVIKLTCSMDIARSDVLSTLFDQCGENPGPVEFSVTGDGGYSQSVFTPDDVRQIVAFADVPFGPITISETIPAGFGVPLAFCSDSAADGPGSFTSVPVVAGNTITLEHRAAAEDELRCGFVNFTEGDAEAEPETGIVRVSKYTCPEGVARSDDDYLLSEQCREEVGQKEFTVSGGGGFFDSHYTSAGVPLETEFTGVPFGEIQIEETVVPPYGEPLAFCSDTPADGAGNYEPVPVTGGDTIAWTLRADAVIPLTCLFFNFMDESEEDGNQLTVTKFDCPEGTSRFNGLPDLGTTCDVVSGVEFTVTFAGSSSTQTTDGTGNTRWTDVPVGAWSLQEAIPARYADPKVFCGPMFTTEAPIVPSPGGLFAGEFSGTGEHMVCTVFNFLEGGDPGTGTVRVSKYACPAGVERSEDDYALSEQCREDVDPVEFSVRDETTYATSLTAAGGVPQEAEFTDVPFGPIRVWETIPAGYGEPLVFCTDTPADGAGNYEPVPVVDGDTITWDLRAEAEIPLACLFFNFTDGDDDGNDVTLQKWTCGPETIHGQSNDYYYDTCTVAGDEDFAFTLTDGVGSHPQATAGGWVTWNDVSAGPIGIQESIPSAYGEPIVLCSDGTSANFRDAPTGYIDHEFTGSGQEFICDWFNLIGEGSDLTVVTFTCPEGYDLHAAGADPTVDCPAPTNGVTFTLNLPDASTFVTMTGDSAEGQIQFGGLPAGSYTLTETVPAGIASSFVLDCYGNRMGGIRP